MLQKSIESVFKPITAIAPKSYAATTTTSAAIDTEGMGDILVLCIAGTVTTSITFKVRHCDTSAGTYADITGAAFPAVVDTTTDEANYYILLRQGGHKRFIKIQMDTVGTAEIGGAEVLQFFPQDSGLALGVAAPIVAVA